MVSPAISASRADGERRSQYAVFGLVSLVVVVFASVLVDRVPAAFRPYFGSLDPVVVVLAVVAVGFGLWWVVLVRGWFVVYEPGALRRGLPLIVGLPTLLALGMATVDVLAVLPADVNVAFPASLLFYPVMGFVVEVLFHLLPLSVAFGVVTVVGGDVERSEVVWASIVAVAVLEPLFQVALGFSAAVPVWAQAYVGLNVFAINVAQLHLLTRYDFASAYAFRLVYYLVWHVVWGWARFRVGPGVWGWARLGVLY